MSRITGVSTVVSRACIMAVAIARARTTGLSTLSTTALRAPAPTSAVASRSVRRRRRDHSSKSCNTRKKPPPTKKNSQGRSHILPSLFYFFNLLPEPGELPAGVDFLGDVGDLVAHHIFDGVFINAVALGHSDKVGTTVMRAVVGVQL